MCIRDSTYSACISHYSKNKNIQYMFHMVGKLLFKSTYCAWLFESKYLAVILPKMSVHTNLFLPAASIIFSSVIVLFLISSFLVLSFLVRLQILHQNSIYPTSNFWSISFFSTHVSVPHITRFLNIVLHSFLFTVMSLFNSVQCNHCIIFFYSQPSFRCYRYTYVVYLLTCVPYYQKG